MLIFICSTAYADDDFSKEIVKSTPLIENVYMLEGAGGNITALMGPDGVFLVDDDFAEMAPKLLAKLTELKGSTPRYIVNTHFHYDHTGGNEVFGPSATIIAASAVRDRLMKEQMLWKKKHPAMPAQAIPSLVFEKSISLYRNGEEINIVHYEHGHTDGDTVVSFKKANVISMGDLYFAGMYPIFHPEHEGSLRGFVKTLEEILGLIPEGAKIVPGHGPLSTKAEMADYLAMIKASIVSIKNGISEGKSLEQIQKNGLDKKWESFSHGYISTDRWIALLYDNILKEGI